MKLHKPISYLFILIMAGFLLTACGNETSYINDQRGKSIPVTASGSNTYTFKLSAEQIEKPEITPVEVLEETTPEEPEEPTAEPKEPAAEPEEPAAVGPKTGEP